jgi:hypothetical protein
MPVETPVTTTLLIFASPIGRTDFVCRRLQSGRSPPSEQCRLTRLSSKLLKNGTLKTYKGFPHGMPTTEADTINADLLAFIKG